MKTVPKNMVRRVPTFSEEFLLDAFDDGSSQLDLLDDSPVLGITRNQIIAGLKEIERRIKKAQ